MLKCKRPKLMSVNNPKTRDRASCELNSRVSEIGIWPKGEAPISVLMITLNEEHNIGEVLDDLWGWAADVFIVDSYSSDKTVDIALGYGATVVQRGFRGFGDQWNFALNTFKGDSAWVMKLDPDERLSQETKCKIASACNLPGDSQAFSLNRNLWFMGKRLLASQSLVRIWRNGKCKFTDVAVNEHPVVEGAITHITAEIAHHDSPDLHHWLAKQNNYTSAEAVLRHNGDSFAFSPKLFGDAMQRRMWLKKHFHLVPFRYSVLFVYHFVVQGGWRAGRVGLIWSRLRCDVMRLIEYKAYEMRQRGNSSLVKSLGVGEPDDRVKQYE